MSDLDSVIQKKSNIVYRALKLHLKKKPETSSNASSVSSTSSTPSIAYPVYLIIT